MSVATWYFSWTQIHVCSPSVRSCPLLCLLGTFPLPTPGLRLLPGARVLQDGEPVPLLPLRVLLLPLLHPQPGPLQPHERQVPPGLQQGPPLQAWGKSTTWQPGLAATHVGHLDHQPVDQVPIFRDVAGYHSPLLSQQFCWTPSKRVLGKPASQPSEQQLWPEGVGQAAVGFLGPCVLCSCCHTWEENQSLQVPLCNLVHNWKPVPRQTSISVEGRRGGLLAPPGPRLLLTTFDEATTHVWSSCQIIVKSISSCQVDISSPNLLVVSAHLAGFLPVWQNKLLAPKVL